MEYYSEPDPYIVFDEVDWNNVNLQKVRYLLENIPERGLIRYYHKGEELMAEPSMLAVKNYFGQEKPVGAKEMTDFWRSLTDEEKEFYKTECHKLLNA